MLKKGLAILAIPVLLFASSCKPKPETTTDTAATDSGATATTQTFAPPPITHEIDHYKFWKVKPVQFERTVTLKGQFDTEAWSATVNSIQYLGNPVEKNGGTVIKPDWHLVAYVLKAPPQPQRSVMIENQFRKGETLKLGAAAWLLLPAAKGVGAAPASPPQGADHYVCYDMAPDEPVSGPVTLVDQFDRMRNDKETINTLYAMYFCVPVSKDGGPIYNEREHLTIYRLDPPDPYPLSAATLDQFGPQQLNVVQSELLAVPTFKTLLPQKQ